MFLIWQKYLPGGSFRKELYLMKFMLAVWKILTRNRMYMRGQKEKMCAGIH
jgi:hypothetical protein